MNDEPGLLGWNEIENDLKTAERFKEKSNSSMKVEKTHTFAGAACRPLARRWGEQTGPGGD